MKISNWSIVFFVFALAVGFSTLGCDSSNSGSYHPNQPDISDYVSWMTEYYSSLKDKPLRSIVLPGSHDSGMSLSHNCYLGGSCNTQAQDYDILGQLQRGVRYLDIRPTYLNGHRVERWYTAHGTSCGGGEHWYGCMGQSGTGVFSNIQEFVSGLDSGNKELIIVNISHCYKVTGHTTYSTCDDCGVDDWNDFVHMGLGYLSDYMVKVPEDFSVESTPYDTLMQGAGNVIFRVENDGIPTDYYQGIINAKDFPIYNDYANTEDLDHMMQDQLCKFMYPANHAEQLFLLSWTLTLSPSDAITCAKTILGLADEAKSHLIPAIDWWTENKHYINKEYVPNIIYTDASNGVATQAAIKLNTTELKPYDPGEMGYWILKDTGYVKQYGNAICVGIHKKEEGDDFVDMAVTPTGMGYTLLTDKGGINCYGDAKYHGHHQTGYWQNFAALAMQPHNKDYGYCMMDTTGGVNCYNADYYGHHGGDETFVDMQWNPEGTGYYLLSKKGGINCYGKATYYGHHPHSSDDFVALAVHPQGGGYCMLTNWGGVNCYGNAPYYGHHPDTGDKFVDMAWTPTGKGYWLMTDSGGINAYGDAIYYGHGDWYGEAAAIAPSPVYNKPTQSPGLE